MKSLLIFLLTFPAILFSQQATVDSLQSLLDKTSDQKEQARLMNLLADGYKGVDPMKTREFAEKAYGIGSKLNNKQIQADALHKKGLSYYYLDSYDTAISYYRQSLMMADGIKDSSLTAQAYSGIGNVYRLQGVNDTALFYLQKALEIYTEQKDQKNIAAALSTIGDTYLYAGDYDKALDDYNQALGIARKIKDKYREAFCLSSIGNNYFMRGDFPSTKRIWSPEAWEQLQARMPKCMITRKRSKRTCARSTLRSRRKTNTIHLSFTPAWPTFTNARMKMTAR